MRKTHSSAHRARYNRNVRTENVQHREWNAYVDSAQIADHTSLVLFLFQGEFGCVCCRSVRQQLNAHLDDEAAMLAHGQREREREGGKFVCATMCDKKHTLTHIRARTRLSELSQKPPIYTDGISHLVCAPCTHSRRCAGWLSIILHDSFERGSGGRRTRTLWQTGLPSAELGAHNQSPSYAGRISPNDTVPLAIQPPSHQFATAQLPAGSNWVGEFASADVSRQIQTCNVNRARHA